MRTLVVGIYPPPASAQARGTMALVRDLAENGHDVDVLAQQHAASLLRSRIDGPVGAWNLWRHRRGYDETFVMVDAVLRYPAGRLYRLTRVIDCAAWGLVLRLLRRVALVVRDPGLIPGSVGGRTGRMLWKNASRILVANDYSAQMLVDQAGAPSERIEIAAAPTEMEPDRWNRGWTDVTDQASAEAAIRRRAAQDRRRAAR